MKIIKYLFLLLLTCSSTLVHAQQDNESAVGKFMRSEERAYVVIAVILTIFTGLVLYLVKLDRKLSRLEKEK